MSEPEISRRCPECGASIRAGLRFCPHCGKGNATLAPNKADRNFKTRNLSARDPEWGADRPSLAADKPGPRRSSRELDRSSRSADGLGSGSSRATIHRATAAARDAIEENVLTPVKKLRNASSFVLEEAADEPSLRFVLIAVVLFVLFLVLLILSKVIG